MFNESQKLKTGFTLIELLVVMAIIGILTGLSIFGMQGAKRAARDAQRKSDLEQIRSGLEIYKADCGSYPTNDSVVSGNPLTGSCPTPVTYITKVPSDPSPGYSYTYNRLTTSTYTLSATLEQGGTWTVNNP